MKKQNRTLAARLGALVLALAMLLALTACGQRTERKEDVDPAAANGEEMNRDGVPSATLQGIYDELTADYSAYSEAKSYYAQNLPEVQLSEELEADGFTITLDSQSQYVDSGSWKFTDEGSALTTTVSGGDYTGAMYVLNVVEAVASYYGMNASIALSYANGLGVLGVNNDEFSITRNADGSTTYRIGTAGPWAMRELDQMVITENAMVDTDPLDQNDINITSSVGKIRMYSIGNVDSFTALFYEYEGLDDVAYQSIMNVVKTLQPKGWENFAANFTSLESVQTDEYTVTVDPDEDAIFEIVDEIDGLYRYVLVQFGEPQNGGNDGYDETAEVADSMLSGMWQDEISQRASLDVVMYSDGHYEMTVMWGGSASEAAVWEFSGYFTPGADDRATITYDDGYYSVRTYDASGNETITQEATTQGSITLQEDGKLRWTDSQVTANGYSDGCLFVQVG